MIDRSSRKHLLLTTAHTIEQRAGSGREAATAIAAAKAIYAIYAKLSDLNSKKKKAEALAEISGKLTQILQELGEINRKLDRIFEKLDVIEDKIDQIPFRAAAIDNAGARETISENFEHWSSNSVAEDVIRDVRDSKARLARNTRVLMAGRKMAYIYDVILSYVFELNLDLILDTPKSTLIAATTKVIAYLKEARDPMIDESLGFYNAASRPTYDALLAQEAKLDREDFSHTTQVKTQENNWGYVMCTFDVFHLVVGSLKERDLKWKTEWRNQRDCFAYNYPNGPRPLPFVAGDDRAVAGKSHIDAMLSRFIPHADVVEFTEPAMETIDRTILLIEKRLENQLKVVAA